MPKLVVAGATATCSMGATPAPLAFPPAPPIMGPTPVGNMMAVAPMTNIPSFGLCKSIANPAVSSATSAAMGVLTPQPCVPSPAGPWANPSKVLLGSIPALTDASTLKCAYQGQITIISAGQPAVEAD